MSSADDGYIGLTGSSPTGRYGRASNGNCRSSDGVDGDDDQAANDVVRAEVNDAPDRFDPGTVRHRVADRPPQRREQRGWVRSARAGITEHDEQDQGEADTKHSKENLERYRDGGRTEDEECPEPPQCHEVPGEGTEDGADDDRSPESGEDGVGDDRDQAVDGAAGSSGSGPLAIPRSAATR